MIDLNSSFVIWILGDRLSEQNLEREKEYIDRSSLSCVRVKNKNAPKTVAMCVCACVCVCVCDKESVCVCVIKRACVYV